MSKKAENKPTFLQFGKTQFVIKSHKGMTKKEFEKRYSKKFANWEEIYEKLKAAS